MHQRHPCRRAPSSRETRLNGNEPIISLENRRTLINASGSVSSLKQDEGRSTTKTNKVPHGLTSSIIPYPQANTGTSSPVPYRPIPHISTYQNRNRETTRMLVEYPVFTVL